MKFEDFSGLYPVSKTLRFEAKPIGETLNNIIKSGILNQDRHRAESYQKVKKLIDEYHKEFIDEVMSNFSFPDGKLEEYRRCYFSKKDSEKTKNKSEKAKKDFEKAKEDFNNLQSKMRNTMFEKIKGYEKYKHIDKQVLINKELVDLVDRQETKELKGISKDEAKELIKEFKGFTTYFRTLYENRKTMYSPEEHKTAIPYRVINQNLRRFIDNSDIFTRVSKVTEIEDCIKVLYEEFKQYLNIVSIDEMFNLNYYNEVLTQKQIDLYNAIIGGKTNKDDEQKVQGLNECINLYNQHHKDAKLPKFQTLYKQILSDRVAVSWLPEEFTNDQQVLDAIKDCYDSLQEHILGERDLKYLLESLPDYDLNGIFIRNDDKQLKTISQKTFGRWNTIENAIKEDIRIIAPARKKRETEEDYQKRIDKIFSSADSFSIEYINECLSKTYHSDHLCIESHFTALGSKNTDTEQRENVFDYIKNTYTDVKDLLSLDYPMDKNLAQDAPNVEKIKNLLDAIKELQWFIKPLLGCGNESDKDECFYGEISSLWEQLDIIRPLYDKIRNYITKKPYSQDKIKLNFENAELFNGWDENKEIQYGSIILRRNGLYYIAIMNKANRSLLGQAMPSEGECYERMTYKLLPKANLNLPRVFFSKSRIKEFNPSAKLLDNYKRGTHTKTKGKNFNLNDCHELIDFFKRSIDKHEDWKKFGFKFSDTSSYQDINDFYKEVEQQGYRLSFVNVSASYIDKLVQEGKMYLFQLYNKDFSEYSKGTPNMHTLYWNALFHEDNLRDVVYKLNGQAEMFFRESSIENNHPTHKANCPIQNKNKHNSKKESVFNYDLIKDKRYTVDKFLFHIGVSLNFQSSGTNKIDKIVRTYLQSADDTHVIGIDRGERHLIYVVVSDKRGNIKEQFSLNEILNEHNGNLYKTNYHNLLDERESGMKKARQSWQTIENIKDLKEGYLSQVVHKIAQMMIKYKAIVVLEDLNIGFMRERQKVEKQVYQKFEKMLIDKLNYLVDKKADANKPGGTLNAYQLTSKFESFQKLGKQSGFLFYIPAWNTSKIDPVTGFVNLFDLKYESIDKSKAFFSKFNSIRYNDKKGWFELSFDYNNFNSRAEGTKSDWILSTQGERIITFRNPDKNSQWDNKVVDLTQEFKDLFNEHGIDIHDNLKEAISNQNDKAFFEKLLRCLQLTLQMRNSISGTETDYLISPVADENGVFYDSRSCTDALPKNADANGAYNIARKGLMLIDQIKKAENTDNIKFDISNNAWLNFAQQKPYRNE